jgi:hypothetical protein
MRIADTASGDEVVATFLRGDLDSPRFGDRLRALLHADGTDVSVIADADLTDPRRTSTAVRSSRDTTTTGLAASTCSAASRRHWSGHARC